MKYIKQKVLSIFFLLFLCLLSCGEKNIIFKRNYLCRINKNSVLEVLQGQGVEARFIRFGLTGCKCNYGILVVVDYKEIIWEIPFIRVGKEFFTNSYIVNDDLVDGFEEDEVISTLEAVISKYYEFTFENVSFEDCPGFLLDFEEAFLKGSYTVSKVLNTFHPRPW